MMKKGPIVNFKPNKYSIYEELGERINECNREGFDPLNQILKNQETIMMALSNLPEIQRTYKSKKAA